MNHKHSFMLQLDLLQVEFDRVLLFVSDICKISNAFIVLENNYEQILYSKIGLEFLTNSKEISSFQNSINQKESFIDSNSNNAFSFFASFPINIPGNMVSGTLCILNEEPKELSGIELKTLEYTIFQLESFLSLYIENDKLKVKENQSQLFEDNSREIFYELDFDGNFSYVSKNWTLLLGHPVEDVLGKNFALFVHPDDIDLCFAFLTKITKSESVTDPIYRVLHKDGYYVWHTSKAGIREDYRGTCYIAVARDITTYVINQEKLQKQKEFYETILDRLPTDVAVFDKNHSYLYVNPVAIKNNELRAFIIGKNDFEYAKYTNREDSFAVSRREKFNEALKKGKTISWEDKIDSINSEMTYHTRKFTPVFCDDGTLEMMIGFGVDITTSKRIQQEILKSKQLTSSIIQNVAVGILVQGPNSEIIENNSAACEMLGLTEDQLLGKTSFDPHWNVIHLDGTGFQSEDHPVPKAIKELKPINNVVMGVFRPITNDRVWLLVDAIPVFGENNELLYVVCSFNDISQLKKSEEALKISNERFSYSSEATSDAIWDWNIRTDEIFVGASYSVLFGHFFENNIISDEECANFVHPEDRESYFEKIEKAINGTADKWSDEYRYLKSDGTYAFVNDKAIIIRDETGLAIRMIGAMQDITEYVNFQKKLQKQKVFYERILDQLPLGVAVYDSDFRYKYLNPEAIKNDELRKFIIGKNDLEYARHTNRDDAFAINRKAKYEEAILHNQTVRWEDQIKDANGQISYNNRVITPVFQEDGMLEMLVGFGIDITESKKAQDEILQSKQLTSSIIQNVAVGILVQGPNSEIIENNSAACEMLGLTEDQLLGKTSFDPHWNVIHLDGTGFQSEDHPVPKAIKELKPINNVVMGVFRPITNDRVWLLVDAIPVFGENNELLYVVCSFNDISQLKKSEEALKISNERFSYSSEATSDAIWDWNIRTDEIFVGASYSVLFGHFFENNIISDEECANFVHPEDRESYFEKIEKAINGTADKWSDEYRYLKSDGTYAFVNDKAIIIRDETGLAIRMIGAMQDITIGNKLKEELQLSEQQFKGAFEHSAVGMAIVDKDFYWKETNDRLCEILGYTKEEFKAMTTFEITYPDDLEEDLNNKEKLASGNFPNISMEKRYIHKNKSIVWTHLFVSVVKNDKEEILHYIPQIIDISERKKVEEENKLLTEENNRNKNIQLNEAKNLYRILAENMVDLVCVHNLDGTLQFISPSVEYLLGYNALDLMGKLPFEYVHPEDLDRVQNHLLRFIDEKEEISLQLRFRNSKGDYIWFETKAKLVKENGVINSFISTTRDISQRKEAEAAIEKTLLQERELNELRNNLVSTVSHEFRTPMTTIRTSAELIKIYLEGQSFSNYDRLFKHIHTIIGEIDRIVELMNIVLIVSKDDAKKTNFKPIQFDLKETCLDVISASFINEKEGRKVITIFNGANFIVFGDKNLMEYTLFNLLNNAFKYSKGCGDVVLELTSNKVEVVIQIIDFGIGIPKEDQPKLFNTFFRASNTNGIQGTGLGLYIVKTFTEKNYGNIQLESDLGEGTKVTLKFPKFKL